MKTLEEVRERIKKNIPAECKKILTFERQSTYSQVSVCKRFTVCKFFLDSVPMYSAWMGKEMLGTRFKTPQEAFDLCNSYAHELAKSQPDNTVPAMLQKKSKAEQITK